MKGNQCDAFMNEFIVSNIIHLFAMFSKKLTFRKYFSAMDIPQPRGKY